MRDTKSNLESRIVKPIFVIACCNSGTTILWDAIKSHRNVSGPLIEGQDLEGMPDTMRHYLGDATFRLWAHYLFAKGDENGIPGSNLAYYVTEENVNEADKQQFIQVYLQNMIPGTRLSDKSPAHTLRARYMQGCFPDAYFVAIARNGYAISEGIRRKRLFDPKRPQYKGLYTEIRDAAYHWNKANEILLSYKQLNLLDKYMIIRYEDLVNNTKQTLFSVLDFCGLDKTGFSIPKFEQDHNEKQISRLTRNEINTITLIAEPMLTHFGYGILQSKITYRNLLP